MLKNSFKENWLIVVTAICFCAAISFFLILDKDNLVQRGKDFAKYPFILLALLAVLFAPIVEELSFRGFYSSKRILKLTSIIVLPIVVILTTSEYWFLLGLFYLIIFLHYKLKKQWIWKISIIINAFLFAVMHYSIDDLLNFGASTFFFQLAFGFLNVWIVLNYNLFKAVIVHFAWNGVLMTILFFAIQFPDDTEKFYSGEKINVTWSKSPHFSSKSGKISINDTVIKVENLSAKFIYDILDNQKSSLEVYQVEPFMKYNMELKLKDSLIVDNNLKFLTKEFLENQNLVNLNKE